MLSALLIATSLGALPPTIAYASRTITFVPTADAFVRAAYPNANYGKTGTLRARSSPNIYSYLRFSVQGLNGSSISWAQLRVYVKSSSSFGLRARVVTNNSWGETTITYNNRPALGTGLGYSGAVSSGHWVSMDVTSYVKAAGTYTIGISTGGLAPIFVASRETGAGAPRLVLTVSSSSTSSGSIRHIFVVVMENHGYSEVWNTRSTPYITKLGNSYVRATNYHATSHPSLPNYLDMYAGSHYGITNDCSPSSSCHVNARSLADNLQATGLTWKGYMDSIPSACYLKTSGTYAPKHNPFVYFDDIRTNSTRCAAHVVAFTALSTDLGGAATTPNYIFITPNLCNDMHDCSVSTGDNWLKSHMPAILNSPACRVDKCLVALTWDEDDSSQSNQVLTIFAGSGARTGGVSSSISYTHYSLLRTVENIFGLPTQTSNDAAASPMTDMLR